MSKPFEFKTPMLQQYAEFANQEPVLLHFMRVGDFYEAYGPHAETLAQACNITLTGRQDGDGERVSMSGVPFHSFERYLAVLVAKGYNYRVIDQLEDPKLSKGLVKRGVVEHKLPLACLLYRLEAKLQLELGDDEYVWAVEYYGQLRTSDDPQDAELLKLPVYSMQGENGVQIYAERPKGDTLVCVIKEWPEIYRV